jgi:hypothetical protein
MSTPATCPAPTLAREQLFSLTRNGREIVCEVQDLGSGGVEVQFLSDRALFYSHRLGTYELAIEWAHAERRAWGWTTDEEAA